MVLFSRRNRFLTLTLAFSGESREVSAGLSTELVVTNPVGIATMSEEGA